MVMSPRGAPSRSDGLCDTLQKLCAWTECVNTKLQHCWSLPSAACLMTSSKLCKYAKRVVSSDSEVRQGDARGKQAWSKVSILMPGIVSCSQSVGDDAGQVTDAVAHCNLKAVSAQNCMCRKCLGTHTSQLTACSPNTIYGVQCLLTHAQHQVAQCMQQCVYAKSCCPYQGWCSVRNSIRVVFLQIRLVITCRPLQLLESLLHAALLVILLALCSAGSARPQPWLKPPELPAEAIT